MSELGDFIEKIIKEDYGLFRKLFKEIESRDTGSYADELEVETLTHEYAEALEEYMGEVIHEFSVEEIAPGEGGYITKYTIILTNDDVIVVDFTKGSDAAHGSYASYTVYKSSVELIQKAINLR